MKILAIETSCDETAAAVVENTKILSSVRWSQTEHAAWGGVVPSIAKRAHQERIDEIINTALQNANCQVPDAIAVTVGPGLAIALGVGIAKAKELAQKYDRPLIAVNHIEGHILSALTDNVNFPCLALVVSGGHTELILVGEIGKYKILAEKIDDALGEALDKAARMLGLGYPGGVLLEKAAALGNPKKYKLPRPMAGREDQNQFSYSGLKTAFFRLVQEEGLNNINDLAASFQHRAFEHLTRVLQMTINDYCMTTNDKISSLLVGGGVIANQELRRRLLELAQELNLKVHFAPMELCGDNAAMIGVAACFKFDRGEFADPNTIDRMPRLKISGGGGI